MSTTPKVKIKHEEYCHWLHSGECAAQMKKGARYGQAFFNHFQLTEPWPELFYEENTRKAQDLINASVEFVYNENPTIR